MNRLKSVSVRFVAAVIFGGCLLTGLFSAPAYAQKKILIVNEGSSDLKNPAVGMARQLGALLGHFSVSLTLKGASQYQAHELNNYDFVFYAGFNPVNHISERFAEDVFAASKPVFWISTGMYEFSHRMNTAKKFGFTVASIDSAMEFSQVRAGKDVYDREEMTTSLVQITNRSLVQVLATAYSPKKKKETPYIIRSGNLTYIADSPFAYTAGSDRYLYFADMLHDVLGEQHEEMHGAMIRIEDVDVFENPDQLREIADILSAKGIPFMVGVIPFYVNPTQGIRLSLSDRPELVDALQYMVRNGGTIVMHGVTHQYKGTTAVDFEFWDESTNKPIKEETAEGDARKLESGIQEFMKNGLYPLVWETPHYTASFTLYKTAAKYFSAACEQRLAIEDADFSQFFPYIIKKDLFGQTIFPENLGYIPLNPNFEESRGYVQTILRNAKTMLRVRDGIATCFFHPFLNLDLLRELADGLQSLGFTFIDIRDQKNSVHTADRVILSGSQTYSVKLTDQYLVEAYYGENGELRDKTVSEQRLSGTVTRTVSLQPGEFYRSEPVEFREHEPSLMEKISLRAKKLYESAFSIDEQWQPARVAILWNHFAKGGAFNDQASLASVFASVNVKVDTFFIGQPMALSRYNLLIVPFAFVDSLKPKDYDVVTAFVEQGGNIITDAKNDLAAELGIRFTSTRLRVARIRERYFPEESIIWRYGELVNKFEADNIDEVFCSDNATEAPMVIGKKFGKGKVIFISSRFDPHSRQGYSQYPFLLEYVRKYFHLKPVVRREALEMYFDPGFRNSYSSEQLVAQWVSLGIKIIHVAGWHEYPKYTYDYKRLIRVAHANGILVYAWLEPPQVSQKFWTEHAQWREKNYKGEDIQPSWRYPVALTDPQCLDTITRIYRKFLDHYDWDGVNLAELYFEAGRGFEDPKLFTPMHPSARAEVLKRYGFDLPTIFDPQSPNYWKNNAAVRSAVVEYRVGKLQQAYEMMLGNFSEIARNKPGFQMMVTAMDNLGSPELRENHGVDMNHIIPLQKKYGFLLQVEDPENKWATDPLRYIDMGKKYEALIGDRSKLLLDLNIGPFRKKNVVTPFPTLTQTGTESFHLVNAAGIGAPRGTIYSESSINPQDLAFFACALASESKTRYIENGFDINAPYSLCLEMPAAVQEITIDGSPVAPFRNNVYVIPAGSHRILLSSAGVSSFSTHRLATRLMSLTGNLLSLTYGMRDVAFTYESDTRTLASFNSLPTSVQIDGMAFPISAMKGDGCYSIFLPPGRHSVLAITGDQFSYGINVTSLWSTTAIALFGALAVALLLIMYFALKVIAKRQSAK
ncbi:MAG: DUF2334 domain-containing protein [Ignavibacteriales bacterium]|nr:DUF2334 domain-containing protein [Ignavibacteriales bacterium]